MGIFKRIRDITLASIHDLLEQAEDPIRLLNQYLRDMEDEIAEAEVAVAKQIAVEKKLGHQYEEAQELVVKRQAQAVQALEAGNEDLARRALQDKKYQQEKADDFKTQYDHARSNANQLRQQLQEMKEEFDKMKRRRDSLVARAETAKAQKSVNQSLSGIGKDNGRKGFERMSERVLELEAEAEASREMLGSGRTLDHELDALGDAGIEEELAALKAQIEKKE